MIDDDKKKAKVVVGTAVLTMKEILGSLFGIFYFIIATRELSVDGMTVVGVLSMLYTLFPIIFLVAIPTALQKFIAESLGKQDDKVVTRLVKTAFLIMAVASTLSLIISFSLAPLLATAFFDEAYVQAFQLVSLAIATYIGHSILAAVFFGFQLYEKYGAITLVAGIAGRLISLPFLLLQYGPSAFVLSWIIENLLIIVLLAAMRPKVEVATSPHHPIKPLFIYSFPLFCSTCVSYLGSGVFIKLLILDKLPNTELGLYETAIRAVGIPRRYQSTFLSTFFPHLSKIYGETGFEEVGKHMNWAVRLLSFIFSPILIGLGVLATPLFYLLFGGEFERATPIFIVLLGFSLINFLLSPFTQGMQALGYTKRMFHVQLVSTVIAVFSALMLSSFGILGVAVGAETLGLTSSLLNFYFFGRAVRLRIDWKQTISFLLASLVMVPPIYVVLLTLPRYRYLWLPVFIGIIVYLVAVRVLKLVEKRDLDVLTSLFPTRLRNIVSALFGV